MQLILLVFDALRTFDRLATRGEVQREAVLDKDQVWTGLRGLARRDLLIVVSVPRQRSVYGLVANAKRPVPLRGRYERAQELRELAASRTRQQRAIARPAGYSPARPPSHAAQPGALRVVVKGVLDVLRHEGVSPGHCPLADFWPKR